MDGLTLLLIGAILCIAALSIGMIVAMHAVRRSHIRHDLAHPIIVPYDNRAATELRHTMRTVRSWANDELESIRKGER